MQRKLITIVGAIVAITWLFLVQAAAAEPIVEDPACDVITQTCRGGVKDPGAPGNGGGGGPGSGGGKARVCKFGGETIPCKKYGGTWSVAHLCYLAKKDPQPPKSDPVWGGREDGAIYTCYNPYLPGAPGWNTTIWLAGDPEEVDVEQLARQAVFLMQLRPIDMGITPKPGPDIMGYVGAPVWLWVENPRPETTGPISRSASAGGVTVTATARMTQVVWDMDDAGAKVTCSGRDAIGTPWNRGVKTLRMSPTCGYRWQHPSGDRPDQKYTITATSHWRVDWNGGGASGVIEFELSDSLRLPVGEIQVVVE
jgi:hypothetical protein